MPQTLPQELLDVIAHYVPFRAAYAISRHVAITKHKTVDFEVLTQEWTDAINSGNLAIALYKSTIFFSSHSNFATTATFHESNSTEFTQIIGKLNGLLFFPSQYDASSTFA